MTTSGENMTEEKPQNYQSPARLPGESFEDYKWRRSMLNAAREKQKRTGTLLHNSWPDPAQKKGVTANRHPTQHPKTKVSE